MVNNRGDKMKVAIGCDHGGLHLKEDIKSLLADGGYEVTDFGTNSTDSVDYPDIAVPVANAVANGEFDRGILICGTGIGIGIAANKVKGVRAAVCSDVTTAHLVKEHNNANIIAFGARIVGIEKAKDIVKAYLNAEFQGGRHEKRIAMIHEIESR